MSANSTENIKHLICISCPIGCPLTITMGEDGSVQKVTGNTCPRGKIYAEKELTAPTRIVTSIVRVEGSKSGEVMVSCKTEQDIPKDKIFEIVKELKNTIIKAPVYIGDVVKANVANTGVDVVATKEVI